MTHHPATYLLIDASDPAYTVYYKLPAEARDKLKLDGRDPSLVQLLPWEDRADAHFLARILHNDYEDIDIVAGLTALLDRLASTPIGLTCFGGVAITHRDYQHARRAHAAYLLDPAAHTKPPRAQDPTHPLNHLGPLLGW